MPSFVADLAQAHDMLLVLVAVVICAIGCHTALRLFSHACQGRGRMRLAWLGGAALAFGCSAWSTQFLAMLAYAQPLGGRFDVPLTMFALLVALCGGLAGLAVAVHQPGRAATVAAGLVLAGTIGATHAIGMAALLLPAILQHDASLEAVGLAVGAGFTLIALLSARAKHGVAAAMALTAAICGLHFIEMAAITIAPLPDIGPRLEVDLPSMPSWAIATPVAAVSLLILLLALTSVLVDQHVARLAAQTTIRIREFADATFEGIVFYRHGRVSEVNAAFTALHGGDKSVIGLPLEDLFATGLAAVGKVDGPGATAVHEAELIGANGLARPVEVLHRIIERDGQPTGVLALRDITERKQAARAMEQLAHYDRLTGLANNVLFRDRLAQALATAERLGHTVALLSLDLDRFKVVNDLLGHPIGDELLTIVANRLAVATREMDTTARVGGDEFAVIMPLGTRASAAQLAARLVAALGAPYEIDGRSINVGVSIGIGLFPADGKTPETMQRNADLALYRAKQSGRCCFQFFEEAMDLSLQHRAQLEQDLRDALETGGLEVHYQPQFDSATLRLCGYEALVRWQHPQRGTISPAEFVPIAEECGLILPLSRWVLHTACRDAALWPAELSIAVNLSPAEFANSDQAHDVLVAGVAAVLAQTGLDPRRLELEITEGVMIKDTGRTVTTLKALRALGVRIAMDDFGTGFSSLSYLHRFPFGKIKIDRSFIQNLGDDSGARTIVNAIIGLGRSLNLTVTAEGVETQAQLDRLRQMHCDHVQGFLLGRPVPVDRLPHLVAVSSAVPA